MHDHEKYQASLEALAHTLERASERRRLLRDLTDEIRRDLPMATTLFWPIGERLAIIAKRKLFAELGYATFAGYLAQELSVTTGQAYKMIRIAHHFGRADAERIGLECAAALIPYAKQVGAEPGALVRDDAKVGDKVVTEASVREIRAAARTKAKERFARAPAARALKRRQRAVERQLRKALEDAQLGRPRIALVKDELVVRFSLRALATRFAV